MRVRVSGLIYTDSSIVMVKHLKNGHSYWLLPGGGIKIGETTKTALKRELKEELNLKIVVKDFLFVAEALFFEEDHIVQLVFNTEVKNLNEIRIGIDKRVVGFDFIDYNRINSILIYPDIKDELKNYLKDKSIKSRYVYKKWLS